MSKHRVVVCCWLHGHKTELFMTRTQEDSLNKKINNLKAVCPVCRDQGLGNQPIFLQEGASLFNPSKVYRCEKGHACNIGPLSRSMLHVRYGPNSDDFVNVEGTIDDLPELVDTKDIACHHVGADGKPCDCKLFPVDDFVLTYVQSASIKTTTRLGDLWDRAGAQPVRPARQDKDGEFVESSTEKANRERLKRMRERNVPVAKSPGRRIDKPTNTTYERRSKGSVNPDRLQGPK